MAGEIKDPVSSGSTFSVPDGTVTGNSSERFSKDDLATYGWGEEAKKAVIRAVYDDDTADIELIDKDGEVIRDADDQPAYFPRVSFSRLSAI